MNERAASTLAINAVIGTVVGMMAWAWSGIAWLPAMCLVTALGLSLVETRRAKRARHSR